MMKKILITSKNPVKIQATLQGFEKMFPGEKFQIESIDVSSNVADQPKSDPETLNGALNRVNNAIAINSKANYYVGIEAGIEEKKSGMTALAWIVVKSNNGQIGKGKTGTFFLPPRVAELIQQGKELGEADDIVFGKTNSKQQNGAIGLLTENIIDRTQLYTEGVILALIPFKNQNLYFGNQPY